MAVFLPDTKMSDENLHKAESAVKKAGNISADKKVELLGLLSRLKSAIGDASQTHAEDAQRIARLAEASAREATLPEKRPNQLEKALHGLKRSVDKFEGSHPDLVIAANEFATVLADMGI
jgi:prefoldin subunit 5